MNLLERLFGRSRRKTSRAEMDEALKLLVVPELRHLGFKGSMPHFRRERGETFDLLSFQFSQSGGKFCVEIGRFPNDGFQYSSEFVPSDKVRNSHLTHRHRVGAPRLNSDHWFVFEHADPHAVARKVLDKLPSPEFWDQIELSTGIGKAQGDWEVKK